jgi:hypothetical protein
MESQLKVFSAGDGYHRGGIFEIVESHRKCSKRSAVSKTSGSKMLKQSELAMAVGSHVK